MCLRVSVCVGTVRRILAHRLLSSQRRWVGLQKCRCRFPRVGFPRVGFIDLPSAEIPDNYRSIDKVFLTFCRLFLFPSFCELCCLSIQVLKYFLLTPTYIGTSKVEEDEMVKQDPPETAAGLANENESVPAGKSETGAVMSSMTEC